LHYSYLVVEGPQDVEFIGRILRTDAFHGVRLFDELESFWHPLIPRIFPHGGDLRKRVPLPVFFQSGEHSVAIHSVEGKDKLATSVEETVRLPGFRAVEIEVVGFFLDADFRLSVAETFARFKGDLQQRGLRAPETPGVVSGTTPRTGMYIFPDNEHPGTLENLLDTCADTVYPALREKARQFTAGAAALPLMDEDRSEFLKPSGALKITVGCIANFLRPTRAIQVSIADNRWLCNECLAIPVIAKLQAFLKDLIGYRPSSA